MAIAIVVTGAVALGNIYQAMRTSVFDFAVIVLLAYMFSYLMITTVAFVKATPKQIRTWAQRSDRGTVLQRYVFGTAPGPGVSMSISVVAFAVAVVWMPGYGTSSFSTPLRVGLATALVAVAWACVMISFTVAFHADNLVENEQALDFPGDDSPVWSDYVYFGVSVMTTFGTTDINVTSKEMRRTVTTNAIIAFVFNTFIVAAVVSALS
ncbi:DUF1345 domain-containing protein [Nakamurella aerolata]|uniref:DUF1345 domain-containing protein n=1 Tax=Nakamurella aerolata TaxID=1656892 RepID=A0A849A5J1_9ACTN|nr:DUF1345 domain-containing protein [Nakamurella aerolata]